MKSIIRSVFWRNLRDSQYFKRGTAAELHAVNVALQTDEALVGIYENPLPWQESSLAFTDEAIYVLEAGEEKQRIAWNDILDYEMPAKATAVGLDIATRAGKKFLRIAGSNGTYDQFKDAFRFTRIFRSLLRSGEPPRHLSARVDATTPITAPMQRPMASQKPSDEHLGSSGPLAPVLSGGIRALLTDTAIRARLAERGLTTAAAIALASPAEVAAVLADSSDLASTATIQAAAAAEVQYLDQVALGLAPAWKTDPFKVPGPANVGCYCTDSESALGPTAYLTDLLDYLVTNLKRSGGAGASQSLTLSDLEGMLHQPLGDLPSAADEAEAPVRQVRLAVEVLRSYLRSNPPSSSAAQLLDMHEQQYRLAAYTMLLEQAGASYAELRSAIGDPVRGVAVADRLGICAEDLGGLLLSPEQMSEQALEVLFGLQDTTRDPFSMGAVAGGAAGVILRFELASVVWGRDTDPQGLVYARVRRTQNVNYEVTIFRDAARTQQVAHGFAQGPLARVVWFGNATKTDFTGSVALGDFEQDHTFDVDLSAIPRFLAFQHKRLRGRWASDDLSAPPPEGAPPIIDPDLVQNADLRNDVPDDTAAQLLLRRRATELGWASALRQRRTDAGADVRGWLDRELASTTHVAADVLQQWEMDSEQGIDVTDHLKEVGIQLDELRYLMQIRSFVNQPVPAPVTNQEWSQVGSALWQVEKRRMFAGWRAEEQAAGLTLGPDSFVVAADVEVAELPAWQGCVAARGAWVTTLRERCAEDAALREARAAQIDVVETALLGSLREALIYATPPLPPIKTAAYLDSQGDALEERMFLDFRSSAREQTTRVAAAIEALQGLVLAGRTGGLTATYPDLQFEPPRFVDGWKWLGSYATWRAAMGVLLYPENLLLPTLRPAKTPAFAAFLDLLRSSGTPLRPERACQLGRAYYDYLRDVTSLTVHASCYTATRSEGVGSSTPLAYERRIHVFAQGGATQRIYWSSSSEQPSGGQTFWQEVPGIGRLATVVGAVPFGVAAEGSEESPEVPRGRQIYLFARAFRDGRDRLFVTRYDLDALTWDDQPVELSGPDGAVHFDVAVEQRNELWHDREQPDKLHWEAGPLYVAFFAKDRGLFGAAFDCEKLAWVRGGPSLIMATGEVADGVVIDGLCGLVHIDIMSAIMVSASKGGAPSVWCSFVFVRGTAGTGFVFDWPPPQPRSFNRGEWINLRAEGGTWAGAVIYPQSWRVYTFVKDGPQAHYGVVQLLNTVTEENIPGGVVNASRLDPVGLKRISVHCGQRKWDVSARIVFQTEGLFTTPIERVQGSVDLVEITTWRSQLAPSATQLPGVVAGLSDAELAQRRQDLYGLFLRSASDPSSFRTYFEEAYLAVPGQIALELERGGYYDDALDWLRTIYNIGARGADDLGPLAKIYYGLIAEETLPEGFTRSRSWVLDPLNPYSIADGRANSYTRSVLLTIVSCLVAYADSEFARGSLESIARARELYEAARAVLGFDDLKQGGPGCEDKIGTIDFPVGDRTTAGAARRLRDELGRIRSAAALDHAVAEVRHVLGQPGDPVEQLARARLAVARIRRTEPRTRRIRDVVVHRAARAAEVRAALLAQPEVSHAAGVIGAAAAGLVAGASPATPWRLNDAAVPGASYSFCVPPNPTLEAYRQHVGAALAKIRGGRDFAGELRRPDPDDGLGRSLAGTPGVVAIEPTPYRYATVVERARQLVSIAQQVESSMLAALERRDAEAYSALKARQDVELAGAGVRLRAIGVGEARDEVGLAELQRERAQFQVDHLQGLIDQGTSLLEKLGAGLQIGAAVAMIAATGGAGAALTGAAAASAQDYALGQALSSASSAVSTFASFERRQDDWAYQRDVAQKDVAIANQEIAVSSDKVAIAQQEQLIATLQAAQAQAVVDFLASKFTGVELYEWMSDVLAGVYRYFLQQATAMARLAADQLSFERHEAIPPFIRADYWIPPAETTAQAPAETAGLTGSVRLLADLTRLDQYAFATNQRKLQLSTTFSLAHLAPLELEELRRTGVLTFATPMELFDRDFPGHYLRLIRRVRTSVIALIPPDQGIRATLANHGVSRVVPAGTFHPGGPPARALVRGPDLAPECDGTVRARHAA